MSSVQTLIEEAAKAYKLESRLKFLERVARFGRPPHGDSDPGRDAIMKYNKEDRSLSDSFASLVLDYFDTHSIPPSNEGIAAKSKVLKTCRDVLRSSNSRQQRYFKPLKSDAGSLKALNDLRGVYAIIRHDTGEPYLLQDLLILDRKGKGDSGNFATLIGADVAFRGSWCVVEHTVLATTCGRRKNFHGDVATLEFARDVNEPPNILAGVLFGASTNLAIPVILPVLAIKFPDSEVHENLFTLGDENDACLRQMYRGLGAKMDHAAANDIEFCTSILRQVLTGRTGANDKPDPIRGMLVDPTNFSGLLRARMRPQDIILPTLREFVQRNPLDQIDAVPVVAPGNPIR